MNWFLFIKANPSIFKIKIHNFLNPAEINFSSFQYISKLFINTIFKFP